MESSAEKSCNDCARRFVLIVLDMYCAVYLKRDVLIPSQAKQAVFLGRYQIRKTSTEVEADSFRHEADELEQKAWI